MSAQPAEAIAHRPAQSVSQPASNGGSQERRASSSLIAFREDGRLYAGDLVVDIIDYREIRASLLAGAPVSSEETTKLARLESRLRTQADLEAGERRAYHRFSCDYCAHLIRISNDQLEIIDVRIVDLGGGGAKVELSEALEPGETIRLMLKSGLQSDRSMRATFDCRVAWALDGTAGIMFAGPASSLPSNGSR